MTKSNNSKQDNNVEFQKQLEKKIGTWSKDGVDCGIGFHAWIDKLNGAVVCYVCGKVLYRNESEYPKP